MNFYTIYENRKQVDLSERPGDSYNDDNCDNNRWVSWLVLLQNGVGGIELHNIVDYFIVACVYYVIMYLIRK